MLRQVPTPFRPILVFACILIHVLSGWVNSGLAAQTGPTLRTYQAPAGTPLNTTYKVEVREPGGAWQSLSVYTVKVGHQAGDPLRLVANPKSRKEPADASFVLFDFDQTLEIQITYTRGAIATFQLSPDSYGIKARLTGSSTVAFTLDQKNNAPRKLVFRPNDDYEADCLHLLTNPVEKDAPSPTDANVLVIHPGAEVPRSLPEGKNVYYFLPGIHTLPVGAWVELDLGERQTIAKFDLTSIPRQFYQMPGGLRFRIESRLTKNEAWKTIHESLDREEDVHLVGVALNKIDARYVRLVLLGNFLAEPAQRKVDGKNYPNSAFIKQFTLYDKGGKNISLGKAVAGVGGDFRSVTDGRGAASFGGPYIAESFLIPCSNTRLYLAPGSVVKGAVGGSGLSQVKISGRGILDGSELSHDLVFREGRTSSIRIVDSKDVEVEGITVLDATMWSVILNQDERVTLRNVNILNSIVNADGIHFSGTRSASATGCFIRACDDLFVIYHYGDTHDIRFAQCVLWSDGGRAALFGMGEQGDIRGVCVEDCDVLACQGVWDMEMHGAVFMVWPCAGRVIEDITFKDIRIEAPRYPSLNGLFQLKTLPMGRLAPGKLSRVRLENIQYPHPGSFRSRIVGADEDHPVVDVHLKRIRWGQDLLDAENAGKRIDFNPWVKGLVIE
jgi:hypothetical protein